MASLPDDQNFPPSPQTGIVKEKEMGGTETVRVSERVPIVELDRVSETEAEKEGYLERVEKEVELKKPVTDDGGQILVTSTTAQTPKIVLPLREDSYLDPANWHRPLFDAIRWLLAWTKRIIKMKPGQTVFREREIT